MRNRPVYYPQLGAFLAGLREKKAATDPRWAHQTFAEKEARRLKIRGLSRQRILRMERGQVKDPDPAVLKGFARLYGVPPELVIAHFVREKYAVDLIGHTAVVSSSSQLLSAETQRHDAGASHSPHSLSADQLGEIVRVSTDIRALAVSAGDWADRLERLAGDLGVDLTRQQTPMAGPASAADAEDVRGDDRPNDRARHRKRRA